MSRHRRRSRSRVAGRYRAPVREPAPTLSPVHTDPLALRRLLTVFGVVAGASLLSYLVPGLERFRPWSPGSGVPIARLFSESTREETASVVASEGYRSPTEEKEDVAQKLGDSIAANLGESAGVPTGPKERAEALSIDPREYKGISVSISDATGRALLPFYRALERTARGDKGALTRVGHWGDSSIATDLITYTLRRRLQQRFGDGGHGFMLPTRGSMPYGHRDVVHRSDGRWDLRHIVFRQDRDGLYGYGGVQCRALPGAFAFFSTDTRAPVGDRVSRFEVYYQAFPQGGNFELDVDGKYSRVVSTREATARSRVASIEVPDGMHALSLRNPSGSAVRLYGVVLERSGPGVVYDSLGLVGARAQRLLNFDPEHIREQVAERKVHLIILGFGGNEASDRISSARYEQDFVGVIRRMRGDRKDVGCLVFSPLDQANRDASGEIRTFEGLPKIVDAQRRAAEQEGCAFYDTFRAMGGKGAMARWYASRPRLALGDFRHATPAGYEVIANMFYKALLQGFAHYLDEAAPREPGRQGRER